ncbi:hypothetical protein JCM10296v2_001034 [Rhodotorula toruloides]
MPLPDESRPGRASELIRQFQAAVDTAGEKPLTVSSSFAAPAAPPRARVSEPEKEEEKGTLRGKGVVEEEKDYPLFFRSAGLEEKPAVPAEQQGRKNAKEAFPDVKEAPKVEEVAREMEENAVKEDEVEESSATKDEPASEPSQTTHAPLEHPASPPHPINTQPSLDVPPSVPSPGSTDFLSSPSSPAPAEEDREQMSSKAREGLSRPMSPAADEAALRVPPTTDDSSPPPAPAPAPGPPSTSTPSRPPRAARTSPTTSRAFPAPSPSPISTPRRSSTSPTTSRLTAPTASSLAKSVSRPTGAAASGSPSVSPARSRKPVGSSSAGPRLGTGGGGGGSASMARPSSGGGASSTMRKSLSSSSTSSSGAAAAKRSSGMTRSTSSSPSASPRLGSPAAGRNGTPLRMARTGRVGLAGAHATRPPPRSSPAPASSSPKPAAEGQNASRKAKEDDIPIFPGPAGGFLGPGTSRPIGKIGIPVLRNEETGEVEAVGRGEVERAGEEARRLLEEGEGRGAE